MLADVIGLAEALQEEAGHWGFVPAAIGIGVAELVDREGRVVGGGSEAVEPVLVGDRVDDRLG